MGSEDMDFAIQVGAVIDMPLPGSFHISSTLPKQVTCQNSPKFHTWIEYDEVITHIRV